MQRTTIAICLAATLAAPARVSAHAPASKAAAQDTTPAEPTPETASMLDVHVAEKVSRADTLSAKIRDDVVRVLRAHRLDLDAQTTTRLAIGIGGEDYRYLVSIGVMRDGKVVAPEPEPWTCDCTNEELLVKLSQNVVDLLPVLKNEPAPAPAEASSPRVDTVDDGPPGPSDRARWGTLGKAGAGVLALGVAFMVGGGVMMAVGRPQDRDPTDLEVIDPGSDLRVGAYVLLGLGGASILAGATLLGVDLHRHRKRRTTVAPMLGRRITGFSLTTRF